MIKCYKKQNPFVDESRTSYIQKNYSISIDSFKMSDRIILTSKEDNEQDVCNFGSEESKCFYLSKLNHEDSTFIKENIYLLTFNELLKVY